MIGDSLALRVFVSSTSADLKAHRAVARQVINNLRWEAVMMEDFGANPTTTVAACEQELETCQLVLLILAFRKGWVPSVEQGGHGDASITALELAHARKREIPVLAMMANEDWPGKLWGSTDAERHWVEKFRNDLNLPAEFFGPEDTQGAEEKRLPAFRELVRKVLLAYKERLLTVQSNKTTSQTGNFDYGASARAFIFEATGIPIIGQGTYANGPLSPQVLAKALGEQSVDPGVSLATVAEFRESLRLSRPGFINDFCKIVSQQSKEAKLPLAFRMLLDMPALPPMAVVTTYDQLFEDALAERGRQYVVVTHIMHSLDAKDDGKILVLRKGQEPIITSADKVDVGEHEGQREFIVYRPLGSPLLHAQIDPSLEIDTVVVTETDLLTFLGRLENEHTTVPTRFNNWLRRKPLLFLGYGLDLWNYRLFLRVFRIIGERKADAPVLAVRTPTSDKEVAFWKALRAELVLLDANEFARQTISESSPA
ncbi:hypothetical protein YTPLAS72_11210 [Nitrospira sp.]|nr:hypothetical protein YTPLAS72_11210 [Nitrospira sp.]